MQSEVIYQDYLMHHSKMIDVIAFCSRRRRGATLLCIEWRVWSTWHFFPKRLHTKKHPRATENKKTTRMIASVLDKNLKWNIFSQIKVIDYKIILTFILNSVSVILKHTHICFFKFLFCNLRPNNIKLSSEVK